MKMLIALALISSPCSTPKLPFLKEEPMDYVEIAHGISNRIATKLEKKHHMKAMGTAGGMMGNIYKREGKSSLVVSRNI